MISIKHSVGKLSGNIERRRFFFQSLETLHKFLYIHEVRDIFTIL